MGSAVVCGVLGGAQAAHSTSLGPPLCTRLPSVSQLVRTGKERRRKLEKGGLYRLKGPFGAGYAQSAAREGCGDAQGWGAKVIYARS